MKIFVTGGAGYIGSQTVRSLLREQHEVVVFDNLSTGSAKAVPAQVSLVEGDTRDEKALRKVLEAEDFDAVMHFAAKLDVAESIAKPQEYYDNNVNGLKTILKVISDDLPSAFIFSSTAAIYGNSQAGKLVVENGPTGPLNPYGENKFECEKLLKDFSDKNEITAVALRYFNVAGASLDGSNGPYTKSGTTLVKVAAETASGKRNSFQINGTDYPTSDGTCIRDLIHVEDLANLHVEALTWAMRNRGFEIFNAGYGHGYSVKQVVQAMKKVSGVDFKVIEGPRREGDPTEVVANVSKMKAAFGWKPRHDDLEAICKSAFQWEKKI